MFAILSPLMAHSDFIFSRLLTLASLPQQLYMLTCRVANICAHEADSMVKRLVSADVRWSLNVPFPVLKIDFTSHWWFCFPSLKFEMTGFCAVAIYFNL